MLSIQWAQECLEAGHESDFLNIIAAAEFFETVDNNELFSYIKKALQDLGISTLSYEKAMHFYAADLLAHIIQCKENEKLIIFLQELCSLYLNENIPIHESLYEFYLLYHGYNDLNELGYSPHLYYFPGKDENYFEYIKTKTIENAGAWLRQHDPYPKENQENST